MRKSLSPVLQSACLLAGLIVGGCAGGGGSTRAQDSASPAAPATSPSTRAVEAPPPLVLGRDTVFTPDIPYTPAGAEASALQRLNVYAPRGGTKLPVVIFIHGGGWTHGDRAEVGSQPKLFNDAGIVLVSVDYRYSPAVQHPAHVDDVAAAVAWTRANIAKHGGDPTRIFVMGHSAGSHLAAFVATDPRPLAKVGLKLSDLRGAISLDGSAFDIPDRIAKGGEKLAENCRRAFGTDPAAQADASPVNHIEAGKGIPPFFLIYLKEGGLNHAQSQAFSDRLIATGNLSSIRRVDGKTHASLVTDLGTPDNDTAGPLLVSFIQRTQTR